MKLNILLLVEIRATGKILLLYHVRFVLNIAGTAFNLKFFHCHFECFDERSNSTEPDNFKTVIKY